MSIILKAENISKQYRLGTVGTGTISDDFKRWWYNFRGLEDPFLKVGGVNDRSAKATEDYVWALRDINFEVKQGEVLGIIGKNGAGKSTLLKILSRVTSPTTGNIRTKGRIASLLEVGTGFHGELTGRENIYMNAAILGMTKSEVKAKLDKIIDFSGCEMYIDTPVKRYSSGMTVRLGFAVAAHLEPEILVVDEVLSVGDADFQKKAIGKMQDLSSGEGRTVLFVSHNMASVQNLCNRCLVLENGTKYFEGKVLDGINSYLNNRDTKSYNFTYTSNIDNPKGLKINNIKLLNFKGTITTSILSGEKLIVQFEISSYDFSGQLSLGVGIYDQNNNPQFHCSTETLSRSYFIQPGINLLAQLVIDKWPLSQGTFYFNCFLRGELELIEHIEKAIWIDSEKGDYYDTGKLPSWNKGFYCDYLWK
jgi:lipopolysaccharide transport system ATP-binding protein